MAAETSPLQMTDPEIYDAIQRENRSASNLEPKDLAKSPGENSRGSKRR